MRRRTPRFAAALALALALGLSPAPPAAAASLDSEIEKVKKQLADLEKEYMEQLRYRAEYKTKEASIEYLGQVLVHDEKKLARALQYLNQPVNLLRLFVSSTATSLADALRQRKPGLAEERRYLWFTSRFGFSTVRQRPLCTIRIDLLDGKTGTQILGSFGPYQRRVLSLIESFAIPIQKSGLAPGSYRLRAMLEVGGARSTRTVRFQIRPRAASN